MSRIIRRPVAKQDLVEQAEFIAQDNLGAALRFLDAAEQTFAQLARLPRMGKSRKVEPRICECQTIPNCWFPKTPGLLPTNPRRNRSAQGPARRKRFEPHYW